jgi:N-dimethylarginine dimethylaminohydrolase
VKDDPDAIYVYDPALNADDGAVLLRPGKAGRRGEPEALGLDCARAGVPVAARLDEPARAEGGDLIRSTSERCSSVSATGRTRPAPPRSLSSQVSTSLRSTCRTGTAKAR